MFIIKWFLEYHKIWRINANIVQKYCIKGMVKVATINTKRYFTHWNSICRVMTYHLDRHERYTWKEKRCLEVTSKIFFYFCEVSNITYSITNCLEKTKYHLKISLFEKQAMNWINIWCCHLKQFKEICLFLNFFTNSSKTKLLISVNV